MITLTAKITLDDGKPIDINKQNLLSLEQNIIDRSDIVLPSWGIISNNAKITFMDYKGDIKGYADKNMLVSGMNTNIILTDTLTKRELVFSNYTTSSWDYDNDNKQVVVNLTDEIIEWQDIILDISRFNAQTPYDVDGKYIYEYLYEKVPSKYKMKDFSSLDSATRNRLLSFKVSRLLFNDNKLWSAWTTFCNAVQAYIFRNYKGETVFTCRN